MKDLTTSSKDRLATILSSPSSLSLPRTSAPSAAAALLPTPTSPTRAANPAHNPHNHQAEAFSPAALQKVRERNAAAQTGGTGADAQASSTSSLAQPADTLLALSPAAGGAASSAVAAVAPIAAPVAATTAATRGTAGRSKGLARGFFCMSPKLSAVAPAAAPACHSTVALQQRSAASMLPMQPGPCVGGDAAGGPAARPLDDVDSDDLSDDDDDTASYESADCELDWADTCSEGVLAGGGAGPHRAAGGSSREAGSARGQAAVSSGGGGQDGEGGPRPHLSDRNLMRFQDPVAMQNQRYQDLLKFQDTLPPDQYQQFENQYGACFGGMEGMGRVGGLDVAPGSQADEEMWADPDGWDGNSSSNDTDGAGGAAGGGPSGASRGASASADHGEPHHSLYQQWAKGKGPGEEDGEGPSEEAGGKVGSSGSSSGRAAAGKAGSRLLTTPQIPWAPGGPGGQYRCSHSTGIPHQDSAPQEHKAAAAAGLAYDPVRYGGTGSPGTAASSSAAGVVPAAPAWQQSVLQQLQAQAQTSSTDTTGSETETDSGSDGEAGVGGLCLAPPGKGSDPAGVCEVVVGSGAASSNTRAVAAVAVAVTANPDGTGADACAASTGEGRPLPDALPSAAAASMFLATNPRSIVVQVGRVAGSPAASGSAATTPPGRIVGRHVVSRSDGSSQEQPRGVSQAAVPAPDPPATSPSPTSSSSAAAAAGSSAARQPAASSSSSGGTASQGPGLELLVGLRQGGNSALFSFNSTSVNLFSVEAVALGTSLSSLSSASAMLDRSNSATVLAATSVLPGNATGTDVLRSLRGLQPGLELLLGGARSLAGAALSLPTDSPSSTSATSPQSPTHQAAKAGAAAAEAVACRPAGDMGAATASCSSSAFASGPQQGKSTPGIQFGRYICWFFCYSLIRIN